ncbi:hypothetical protein CFC21_056974 [Triticum aestivum]|uniref:F-box domain-containing protein n=3 Tax=Triticum TaxID=4564 RepID=A0A9R0W974_TRITD|nr:F-box/FBD/LRR-repeat protein At5g22660-like [Triticum aestivum]KAF7048165.1 hypothetical protein CFC21_056974 [Triticum aestivum]VAI03283.1 unnamed protein product [Triticum turgidum subsp. durum]
MASSCDSSPTMIIIRRRQVVSPEDLYARQMLDRTLQWRKGEKNQWTPSGPDGLSALPDDAIRHVIGFLPARDAVQTSALALGWRDHWTSMHSLLFTPVAGSVTVAGLKRLVGRLLLDLRAPLDECVIDVKGFWQLHSEFNSLIRHAVSECQVRTLTVSLVDTHRTIYGQPLVSTHLARLELRHVTMPAECTVLDFSSCTALEDLVISCSQIYANKLSSPSLKRLKIEECWLFPKGSPTCISAPNIVSLKLDDIRITTPRLERMPLLETASVRLGGSWPLNCKHRVARRCCGVCEGCIEFHLMELRSFSSATHLELTAPNVKFTVLRCPTFSKLKSLSLNDWCVTDDLSALIRILEHSPVLEKLTLQLNEGSQESYNAVEQLRTISRCLKVVEIKCMMVDNRRNFEDIQSV